ncbi:PIR Superfamily Protein [Plasmodium ovale curtisi]|uniref:PIR Superfamily Protein n=1 Tax=Plasmodium ovale curtisi TaxID=864141 RepID=A0A1A8WBH0_PLAOA|nr:PIR Superfamily Protein [Plasmodium ovale curtisi]
MDAELITALANPIVKKLTAYNIYEQLSLPEDDNIYDLYCKDVNTFDNTYKGIKSLCAKVLRNLTQPPTVIKGLNSEDRCSYFTYWLYDEIWKIIKNDQNHNSHIPTFTKLIDVVYKINRELHIIDCNITVDFNFSEWKKKKYLHDYFKNYNNLLRKDSCNNNECQNYCKYVKYIKTLYEQDKEECCYFYYSFGDECPEYLKCDESYNPDNILSKLKCNVVQEDASASAKIPKPEKIEKGTVCSDPKSGENKNESCIEQNVGTGENEVKLENASSVETVQSTLGNKNDASYTSDSSYDTSAMSITDTFDTTEYTNRLQNMLFRTSIIVSITAFPSIVPFSWKGKRRRKIRNYNLHERDIENSSLHYLDDVYINTLNKPFYVNYYQLDDFYYNDA